MNQELTIAINALAASQAELAASQKSLGDSQIHLASVIEKMAGSKDDHGGLDDGNSIADKSRLSEQSKETSTHGLLFGKPVVKDTKTPETEEAEKKQSIDPGEWIYEAMAVNNNYITSYLNKSADEGWLFVSSCSKGEYDTTLIFKRKK